MNTAVLGARYAEQRAFDRSFIEANQERLGSVIDAFPHLAPIVDPRLTTMQFASETWHGGNAAHVGVAVIDTLFRFLGTDSSTPEKHAERSDIYHSFVLPLAGIPAPTDEPVEGTLRYTADSFCDDAEGYFVAARKQASGYIPRRQRQVSVYHDSEGTPVALRKKYESSTALLLQSIDVEDIIIPPGTIIGLSGLSQPELTGRSDRPGYTLRTFEIGDDFQFDPKRVSA